jgi:glucose/mannose transport system substrate-binding protein
MSGANEYKKRSGGIAAVTALLGLYCTPSFTNAGEVEVLHFWTSPGERRSVDVLKERFAARGHTWKDFSVVGGGGENAMNVLAKRVSEGNPPAAASIKAPVIQTYASSNKLTNLDAMASFDKWDEALPPAVKEQVFANGHYVAVPVNIHRSNWLWSNLAVLSKSGVKSPPTSLPEMFAVLDKVKAAGFDGLAIGGQPWQVFQAFESVLLATGGQDIYSLALAKLDVVALRSKEFRSSLETMRSLKKYTDSDSNGRAWNDTTRRLIDQKAAFQFMGDWVKGEFSAAGLIPGKDYACTAAPGTQEAFLFVIDSFAMFQLRSWEAQKAQGYLAYQIMRPEFQTAFSVSKGSIPAIRTFETEKFDVCARKSHTDFIGAEKNKKLLPSVAVDMVLPGETLASARDIVFDFWSNDRVTVETTVNKLAAISLPPGAAGKAKAVR